MTIEYTPRGVCSRFFSIKVEGIRCGGKPTSCPDQIAKALHTALPQA